MSHHYKHFNFQLAVGFKAIALKTALLSLFTLVIGFYQPVFAESLKIRTVDVSEVYGRLNLNKELEKTLNKSKGAYQKKLEKKVSNIKGLQEKLERSKGTLSAIDYQREKRKIEVLQKEFQVNQESANYELSARQEEERNALIQRKILRPLQQYARANDIDMVIRKEVLFYGLSSVDITKDFVSYLKKGK